MSKRLGKNIAIALAAFAMAYSITKTPWIEKNFIAPKLYTALKEYVDDRSVWLPVMQPAVRQHYVELDEVIQKNKSNLDSLKVYDEVLDHLFESDLAGGPVLYGVEGDYKKMNKELALADSVRHAPYRACSQISKK